MTNEAQREISVPPRTELEDAEKELAHLRDEANQAADSINKIDLDVNNVVRLMDKLKVTRRKICNLRKRNSQGGLGSGSTRS